MDLLQADAEGDEGEHHDQAAEQGNLFSEEISAPDSDVQRNRDCEGIDLGELTLAIGPGHQVLVEEKEKPARKALIRTGSSNTSAVCFTVTVYADNPLTVTPIISSTELGLSSETFRNEFHRTWNQALRRMKRKPLKVMGMPLGEPQNQLHRQSESLSVHRNLAHPL